MKNPFIRFVSFCRVSRRFSFRFVWFENRIYILCTSFVTGHSLSFLVSETYGEESTSILETAELWKKNISAYIGPQETCLHEARMAAAFNLPMISYVSSSQYMRYTQYTNRVGAGSYKAAKQRNTHQKCVNQPKWISNLFTLYKKLTDNDRLSEMSSRWTSSMFLFKYSDFQWFLLKSCTFYYRKKLFPSDLIIENKLFCRI